MKAIVGGTPQPLLRAVGLTKRYGGTRGIVRRVMRLEVEQTLALDNVSLQVNRGESVGIVGESGSGKTTLVRSLVRLIPLDSGQVIFDGSDLSRLDTSELAQVRRRVQLIYQDPYSSLNPALSIGGAIAEPAVVHDLVSKADARSRAVELMDQVGLSPRLFDRRPRELSGGQRQRVAIARALATGPDVLLADEAVSALDVSIQAQILRLFDQLRRELGVTLVTVSHQLGTVAQLCDRVVIMHDGQVVEEGKTEVVFRAPAHSYTAELLAAQPGRSLLSGTAKPASRSNQEPDASKGFSGV